MKKKKKKITSGYKLVDRIFNKVIYTLNNKINSIYLRETLGEKELCGVVDFSNYDIYLNAARVQHKNRNEIARTLLHEVLHFVYPEASEKITYRREKKIWNKLSKRQKGILKFYVPRHIVKKPVPKGLI